MTKLQSICLMMESHQSSKANLSSGFVASTMSNVLQMPMGVKSETVRSILPSMLVHEQEAQLTFEMIRVLVHSDAFLNVIEDHPNTTDHNSVIPP